LVDRPKYGRACPLPRCAAHRARTQLFARSIYLNATLALRSRRELEERVRRAGPPGKLGQRPAVEVEHRPAVAAPRYEPVMGVLRIIQPTCDVPIELPMVLRWLPRIPRRIPRRIQSHKCLVQRPPGRLPNTCQTTAARISSDRDEYPPLMYRVGGWRPHEDPRRRCCGRPAVLLVLLHSRSRMPRRSCASRARSLAVEAA